MYSPRGIQYNGKELNDDFGLNWNDYGARWYDASIGRWNGVDPLSGFYLEFSPYNYVLGKPIKFIDPNGKKVENTIFLDSEGNKLHETKDKLPDAVVIINKSKMKEFKKELKEGGGKTDGAIASLRSLGDTYMVGGLFNLLKTSLSKLTTEHPFFDANNLDSPKPMHPEYAATFNIEKFANGSSVLRLDSSEPYRTSDSPISVGLGSGGNPVAHTHPTDGWHKGVMRKMIGHDGSVSFSSIASATPGPSSEDIVSQLSRDQRFFDVIIDTKNIYLYNRNVSITVPTIFFKK